MKLQRLAASTILIASISMAQPTSATAWHRPKGICADPAYKITRAMPLWQRQDRSRRLIECVFDRIVPGQAGYAIAIASRESGLDPYQENASGAAGLFQHLRIYWPGRVAAYLYEGAFPNTWPKVSPFHARANAIVAARMVKRYGWSAWGG